MDICFLLRIIFYKKLSKLCDLIVVHQENGKQFLINQGINHRSIGHVVGRVAGRLDSRRQGERGRRRHENGSSQDRGQST